MATVKIDVSSASRNAGASSHFLVAYRQDSFSVRLYLFGETGN